jgi:predicted phage terminase large subunit-like protein
MSVTQLEQSLAAALRNPAAALLELDRLDCEEDLGLFLRKGWRYIDPAPYVHGWHLDAIAEHLEAVTYGDIRRLIINIPPRHSKSSIVSVAWPVWTWAQRELGPLSGPQVQFLSASYSQNLSTRDALKSRRLIQSPWFQERWGDRFVLTSDQNAKMRYENDHGGYRIATSVGGSLTGEGGSIILVDDPLNAQDADSDAMREAMVSWWDEAMSTRLNDPKAGAYVIIMQRLHEDDLTGHILSNNHEDWTHLCLPARYENNRHCVTSIGWQDPREQDGEILSPDRFDDESLARLERSLGSYGSAGQLQQRPEPRGGGIFKRHWWQDWNEETAAQHGCVQSGKVVFPPCEYVVASFDGAFTEEEINDPSALTIWGLWRDRNGLPKIMLMSAWEKRLDIHSLVTETAATCKRFRVDRLLIEAKANGLSVAQEMRRLHAGEGFAVQLIDPKREKTARAYAVQPLFEDEMIFAPTSREWADKVISQMASFPRSAHDDLTDTCTQALKHLRDIGLAVHGAEMQRDDEYLMQHRSGRVAPLYPA